MLCSHYCRKQRRKVLLMTRCSREALLVRRCSWCVANDTLLMTRCSWRVTGSPFLDSRSPIWRVFSTDAHGGLLLVNSGIKKKETVSLKTFFRLISHNNPLIRFVSSQKKVLFFKQCEKCKGKNILGRQCFFWLILSDYFVNEVII